MSLSIDQYLATGEVAAPRKVLLTGRYAFYDVYRCRDGKWISVGAIEPPFYRNLCELLGLAEYAAEQMNDEKQDEIRAAFTRTFVERDRDAWVELLADRDTCVAPVYEIPELIEDPHFAARGIFMAAEHPEQGGFRQVAPILAGAVRDQPLHRVRAPGESDAVALLEWAGLPKEEIESLCQSGVVE